MMGASSTRQGNEEHVVGVSTLGSPRYLSGKKTIAVKVYGFADLEYEKHRTSWVVCHGISWCLDVHPWGFTKRAKKNEMVSLFLRPQNPVGKNVEFSFRVGDVKQSAKYSFHGSEGFGFTKLFSRSQAISSLDAQGALTVFVDIQIAIEGPQPWRPTITTLQEKLIQLRENEKAGADVVFSLNGDLIRAHRVVLSVQCPTLHEMVADTNEENIEIVINGADAALFDVMIRFMYSNSLPKDFNVKEQGLELLQLANRFAYTDLKMLLEAELVESQMLTVENSAETLLFADANSCALLKEAAMDMIVGNTLKVMKTEGWKILKESNELILEALEHQSSCHEENKNHVTVSEMRKQLEDLGLDTDGTKDMLVKRLKKGDE